MILGKIVLGTMLVGSAVIMQDGLISVNVREKHPGGHHIWFVAPGSIVPLGLKLVPADRVDRHKRDAREWIPLVRGTLEALANASDAVFVEVEAPDKHVRVEKSWGRLVIDIDDPDEQAHVAVPLRAVRHALSEIEKLQPPS